MGPLSPNFKPVVSEIFSPNPIFELSNWHNVVEEYWSGVAECSGAVRRVQVTLRWCNEVITVARYTQLSDRGGGMTRPAGLLLALLTAQPGLASLNRITNLASLENGPDRKFTLHRWSDCCRSHIILSRNCLSTYHFNLNCYRCSCFV